MKADIFRSKLAYDTLVSGSIKRISVFPGTFPGLQDTLIKYSDSLGITSQGPVPQRSLDIKSRFPGNYFVAHTDVTQPLIWIFSVRFHK